MSRLPSWTLPGWAAALSLVLSLASAPRASASDVDLDTFRTGGCTGCFLTQVRAVLATFSNVKRAFRVCATGGAVGDADHCGVNGGPGSFGDFVMIEGDLRDSSMPANNGLGVPGGASHVTYRISGNGSTLGFQCVAGAPLGFIAPEGLDGDPNTADDAGGTGQFGVPGPGNDGSGGAATGAPTDTAPALSDCDGVLDPFLTGMPNPPTLDAGFKDFCVVNVDRNGDGVINNDRAGIPRGGSGLGSGGPSSETTNLALTCDMGFGDLPPADFENPVIRDLPIATEVFGAQIFKIIASSDVSRLGDPNAKVQLQAPQIENLFGAPSSTSVCQLGNIGATSSTGSDDITACTRAPGSGSREALRLSFLTHTQGSTTAGVQTPAPPAAPTAVDCPQLLESGAPKLPVPRKTLIESGTSAAEESCVVRNPRSFGYVDADLYAPDAVHPQYYGVPVEGVDPDSNDLRQLVRCGLYRFWGPLAGGGPSSSAAVDAHKFAMKSPLPFPASAYLPISEVAFRKNTTDGSYFMAFAPSAADCPGVIAPPVPIVH